MPIYEYRCEECGHQEDHLQKASEAPLAECPACGKPAYRKQLSAAGFQLKGSGWYATDFRGGGKKPAGKGAEASGDAKGDTKSDTKADAKSDAKAEGTGEGKSKSSDSAPDAKPAPKSEATA